MRLMGQIYSQAEPVLVWLGTPIKNTENAFKALENVHDHFKKNAWMYSDGHVSWLMRSWWRSKFPSRFTRTQKQVAEIQAFDWSSISSLLEHPWFQRVWIYQELVKATKGLIVCGEQMLPFWTFFNPLAQVMLQEGGQRNARSVCNW
jgi:hypothetical protein